MVGIRTLFGARESGHRPRARLGFFVPRLNKVAGTHPEYDIRYDLSFNGIINTIDVGRFVPFLNKTCTP